MDTPISRQSVEIDRLAVEHRDAAGGMEAAERDRNAGRPERPRDIERARILVRLHADQPHHAEIAVAREAAQSVAES